MRLLAWAEILMDYQLHLSHETTDRNKMQSETADFAPGAATQRTGWKLRVVFHSSLFSALYENMNSSTKPEVHNVSHCGQRRTEPEPQVACTENVVKFGRLVFEILKQRDKHIRWSQYFAAVPSTIRGEGPEEGRESISQEASVNRRFLSQKWTRDGGNDKWQETGANCKRWLSKHSNSHVIFQIQSGYSYTQFADRSNSATAADGAANPASAAYSWQDG